MSGVFFINAMTGWVVGRHLLRFSTTDGGVTWKTSGYSTGDDEDDVWESVSCSRDGSTCWVTGSGRWTGWTTGEEKRGWNGGSLARAVAAVPTTTTAMLVGDRCSVIGPTDTGFSSNLQSCGSSQMLNAVIFVGPTTGWAVGARGTILAWR